MEKPRVLLAGGGTGGHIFPLIPVIRELKKSDAEVAFIGPEDFPLEALKNEQIDVHPIIRAGKIRRYASFDNITDALKLPVALAQSLYIIWRLKPDVVMGKGGYGSIAPVIAAWMLHIPVVLHESDVIPGMANRMLRRFAKTILLGFEEALPHFSRYRTDVVGNPVRDTYKGMRKATARTVLNFDTQRKIIFVIGGSQGAQRINELVKEAAPELLKRYAIIVSSGHLHERMFGHINVNNALVKNFLNEQELAAAYTLADVVVSRPGASSMFEIATFGKPSVLIPISASTNAHQAANARVFEEREAAVVLDEDKTTPQTLMYAIESILNNYEISTHLARNVKKSASQDAPQKIAGILLEHAQKR